MKNILLIDYEGSSRLKPYNMGIIVYNKQKGIILEKNFIMLDVMTKNTPNYNKFLANITDIPLDITCTFKAKRQLLEIVKSYNIKEIWAFNKSFDKSATERLFEKNINQIPELKEITWYDIQTAIFFTKLLTKKYINFCNSNKFYTNKKHISTNAETIYKYLTNNPNFKEKHNGLADCKIELEMLKIATKTKKKIKYNDNYSYWKILQDFCKSFNPPLKPYD